ncbi:hypothetical protein RI129_002956 [Pyrocoelia pectoralis]|uniref:Regulatory protein zeste n=1 Tax=Pyrocoelia pectoralis TaxID=417401 RepID=A0AAN7VQQ6_9COLE
MSGKVKNRVPNFTTSEKLHLLRIISSKYGSVLEDKKTDRASTEKKSKAWLDMTDEFNATSTTNVFRNTSSLKKCYENRKKELRKTLAEEKKERLLTGGGPPPAVKTDETDDLLMSIMNKSTLVGLHNEFDDDAEESSVTSIVGNQQEISEENAVIVMICK